MHLQPTNNQKQWIAYTVRLFLLVKYRVNIGCSCMPQDEQQQIEGIMVGATTTDVDSVKLKLNNGCALGHIRFTSSRPAFVIIANPCTELCFEEEQALEHSGSITEGINDTVWAPSPTISVGHSWMWLASIEIANWYNCEIFSKSLLFHPLWR